MSSDPVGAARDPGSRDEIRGALLATFPFLGSMQSARLDDLVSESVTLTGEPGDQLMQPGDPCQTCSLLVTGELRVHTRSPNGRALTLYHVLPGEMCALTSMCLLTRQPFPAYAEVVAPTTFVTVPRALFQELVDAEEGWRQFAFQAAWGRVNDLLARIDDVVFTDLPTRLADAVLTAQASGVVELTHARLADEVGSSREVVSRVLKRWEADGVVRLERGRITVESLDRLRRLSRP